MSLPAEIVLMMCAVGCLRAGLWLASRPAPRPPTPGPSGEIPNTPPEGHDL